MANPKYTEEQIDEAIRTYIDDGLPIAAERHGIPPRTITRWAEDRGVDIKSINKERLERMRAAHEQSSANRREAFDKHLANMQLKLMTIADIAAEVEMDMLIKGDAKLSEVVGARTRAIHDLQLLAGKATERVDRPSKEDLEKRAAEIDDEVAKMRERKQAS